MSREFIFAASSASALKTTCTSWRTARSYSRRRPCRWKRPSAKHEPGYCPRSIRPVNGWRSARVGKGESEAVAIAHIRHQHGTKTGKARSTCAADTRIDDSGRTNFKQLRGERLRGRVARGRKTVGILR